MPRLSLSSVIIKFVLLKSWGFDSGFVKDDDLQGQQQACVQKHMRAWSKVSSVASPGLLLDHAYPTTETRFLCFRCVEDA